MTTESTHGLPDSTAAALGALAQPDFGPSPVRVAIALFIILGLIALAVMAWRRRPEARGRSRGLSIDVLGRTMVGNKGSVVLLEVDGRRVLVGTTPTTVTALSEWEAPEEPEVETAEARIPVDRRFENVLGRVVDRLKTLEGVPS